MSTIFAKIINREIPADIIYEDDRVLAFLDINPIRKGHTLVIPKKEYVDIFTCDAETLSHMMRIAQIIAKALMRAFDAKGVNIIMNNGYEAGQDVFHAHIHVVPRSKRGEAFVAAQHETYQDKESAQIAEKIKEAIA